MMPRLRRLGRVAVFNAVGVAGGLVVVACVAEVYARSKAEFRHTERQVYHHPRAGRLFVPGSELRQTNMLDFWTVSRANRWGFLDRPPPSKAGTTRESCRVAVVGDSFVAASMLPVSAKLHVRFEEIARQRAPDLGVVASAYGHADTGQINQLGYYDEFVSRTSPEIVVLVFVDNDFNNNNPWSNHFRSTQVNRKVEAARADDGSFELLPPCSPGGCDPARGRAGHTKRAGDARRADNRDAGDVLRAGGPSASAPSVLGGLGRIELALRSSYAVGMLQTKVAAFSALRSFPKPGKPTLQIRSSIYAEWFGEEEGWPGPDIDLQRDLPPMGREALEYTEFALDQWMARANRDSFALAVLASHSMGTRGDMRFDLLNALASPRGIPVVDQLGYIARQGGRIEDAHWAHDYHWNAVGHQWAAEALMEWLKQNLEACG